MWTKVNLAFNSALNCKNEVLHNDCNYRGQWRFYLNIEIFIAWPQTKVFKVRQLSPNFRHPLDVRIPAKSDGSPQPVIALFRLRVHSCFHTSVTPAAGIEWFLLLAFSVCICNNLLYKVKQWILSLTQLLRSLGSISSSLISFACAGNCFLI